MKSYVLTTGLLFAGIAMTHTGMAVARGHVHHLELIVVVLSAGLAVWAARLARSAAA